MFNHDLHVNQLMEIMRELGEQHAPLHETLAQVQHREAHAQVSLSVDERWGAHSHARNPHQLQWQQFTPLPPSGNATHICGGGNFPRA